MNQVQNTGHHLMKKAIAIFDIGKTNKKILLFDQDMKVVFQSEQKFLTTVDDDGFECEDIDLIEKWIKASLKELVSDSEYHVIGVNFTTYGASLIFLDAQGKRLTPLYNYLKDISPSIQASLFSKNGGEAEFCRKTGSPSLGLLLNSGIQILWLKQEKPMIFHKVSAILHFPQYLSYLFTETVVSESTSIGCHTFLWDFDTNQYHSWLKYEGIRLPQPKPSSYPIEVKIEHSRLKCGIGVHDSSASLVPYIWGSNDKFLLVSTGTWCINMNPFNSSPLTPEQLTRDCLSYLSVDHQTVKSSRLFMGYIHDVNTARLTSYFKVPYNSFKDLQINESVMGKFLSEGQKEMVFFKDGIPLNYIDESIDLTRFIDFSEAYHRLMFDLTRLNAKSIDLILTPDDGINQFYVSGGFARNEIFMRLLASFYPNMKVFSTVIDNSSALGAALVIWNALDINRPPEIDLGLKKWGACILKV
jgi:sugar (pentulose or hexulose) kinase